VAAPEHVKIVPATGRARVLELHAAALVAVLDLCVPKTSSTSCDQAIFADQATDASVSSDMVLLKIDRLGAAASAARRRAGSGEVLTTPDGMGGLTSGARASVAARGGRPLRRRRTAPRGALCGS
jgi:hypothetical protein